MAGQAEALTGGSVRESLKLAADLQEAAGEVFGKLEGEASEAADQFMVGAQGRGGATRCCSGTVRIPRTQLSSGWVTFRPRVADQFMVGAQGRGQGW